MATNFAFQYDSDTGKWSLYIIEKESSGAASVYGSKIWATDLYGPPMVYVDAKELLSTSLPSDVSIATLGLNYRFINNYLQIANYDVSGRYHKIWSTTAGGSPLLYVDSGES